MHVVKNSFNIPFVRALMLCCTIFLSHVYAASRLHEACTILGIASDRPLDAHEVKRAYRQKAKKLHPDHNAAFDAEQRFKELNDAYTYIREQRLARVATQGPAAHFAWRAYTKPATTPYSMPKLEALHRVYNYCRLLGIHKGDSLKIMREKYALYMQRYLYGPLTFEQAVCRDMGEKAFCFLNFELAREHDKRRSLLLLHMMPRPVTWAFNPRFIATSVYMVQHNRVIWRPTLDHMRCYVWAELMADIRVSRSPEHIANYLVANPCLYIESFVQNHQHLQDVHKRATLALEGVHLGVVDLVNMTDGQTDALSEVYRTLDELPGFSDREQRVAYLKATAQLLLSHGAKAQFYPVPMTI